MSWDKNTIVCSQINAIISTLDICKKPYTLSVLGNVQGHGLNDDLIIEDNSGELYPGSKYYDIRKLEFEGIVILEQMQRSHDCDTDDMIISVKFDKGSEPKTWPLEIYMDKE